MINQQRSLALLLVLCLGVWSVTPVLAARLPSAQRECAVCHIMWLNDFKRTDIETLLPYDPTPVTDMGKTDVVSTQRMCFSCHDGFMLDSRDMWQAGAHSHPVGKKPSDKIKIPLVDGKEVFPLNADGNIYCGTCHTAHGVDWEQSESAVFMRVRDESGSLCSHCHTDKEGGTQHGSHPLLKKVENMTRELSEGAKFSDDQGVICQSCHRSHGAADDKMLIIANEKGALCGACHTDHYAGGDPAAAGHRGTHPINLKPVTADIPDQLLQQGAKLTRDGAITCQTCHGVHNGTPDNNLLVSEKKHDEFCVQCHGQQKIVTNGKHDMRLVDTGSRNIKKQSVQEAGVCSACHVVHQGNGPKMWARSIDKDQEPMAALCLSCHNSKGLAMKSLVGQHSHPVGVSMAGLGQDIRLPGFSRDGIKYKTGNQGSVTCASCHDPHQWDPVNANARAKPGTKGNQNNLFLRQRQGPDSRLCRSCHQQQTLVAGTKHDLSHTAPEERNIRGQGPDVSGTCGTCHLVHNAAGPFLWARSWPANIPVNQAACLSCHNQEGLAKERDLGHSHPMGVDLGSLPLQVSKERWRIQTSARVNRPLVALPLYSGSRGYARSGGEIGCGTCHDPHRWSPSQNKPSRDPPDEVEGGPNDSFLRLAAGGDSRLCANCHIEQGDIAGSRHDLSREQDGAGKSKASEVPAGVCLGCHKPHNAEKKALWARAGEHGINSTKDMCTDCHRSGGAAEKKLMGTHGHPLGVKLTSEMRDAGLPVFSGEGRLDTRNGTIDCGTCHDAHIHTSAVPGARKKSTSSTVISSSNEFLRLPVAPDSDLCIKCHREQRIVTGTDHDFRINGPMQANSLGQNIRESGVCGQCHIPHNATEPTMLWGRYTDEKANNPADRRCLSCHNSSLSSEGRELAASGHPPDVMVWSASVLDHLKNSQVPDTPVFDVNGNTALSGTISCSTCHNPHQWDPLKNAPGPGKPTEGDIYTSFLRSTQSATMSCSLCHGLDALFRYKYFHSLESHEPHHLFY